MLKKSSYFLPGLGQSWLLVAILLTIGSILAGLVVFPLMRVFPGSDFVSKTLAYVLQFLPAVLFGVIVGRSKMLQAEATGIPLPSVKLNRPRFGKMNPILFFLLITLAGLSFPFFMDPVVSRMQTPEWFEKLMGTMLGGDPIWTFVTVAICAPLLEETICRGYVCRGLLTHKGPTAAILWSALIFAVMHLNPWQGLSAFVLGVFYGWVYYKTHCLWATIYLHFVNNGLATILTFVYPEMATADSFRSILPDSSSYWMIFAISVGVLALTFCLITKYIPGTASADFVRRKKKGDDIEAQ